MDVCNIPELLVSSLSNRESDWLVTSMRVQAISYWQAALVQYRAAKTAVIVNPQLRKSILYYRIVLPALVEAASWWALEDALALHDG